MTLGRVHLGGIKVMVFIHVAAILVLKQWSATVFGIVHLGKIGSADIHCLFIQASLIFQNGHCVNIV